MQNEIVKECIRLRQHVVQPVSDRYHGPLDSSTVHNTQYPMVLLLGNHSSGKSSFINHLLQVRTMGTDAGTDTGLGAFLRTE